MSILVPDLLLPGDPGFFEILHGTLPPDVHAQRATQQKTLYLIPNEESGILEVRDELGYIEYLEQQEEQEDLEPSFEEEY